MTKDELSGKLVEARQYAAIATAFSLPVSTSAQAIAVSIFAVLALLTLDRARFEATLRMPAAWLPVALFALILFGVLWSIQPWALALKWVGPYAKLLLIPLTIATAFTPRQALQVGAGFVAACVILLALSAASFVYPSGPWTWFKAPGVPVKDNAVQSACFALCAFGLALGAFRTWNTDNRRGAVVMGALALLFFTDVFLIYLSKTGAIMAMVLLALLMLQITGWKLRLLAAVPAVLVIAVALLASAPAQLRLAEISMDIHANNRDAAVAPTPPAPAGTTTTADIPVAPATTAPAATATTAVAVDTGETLSTGARLDFWKKAIGFVKQAPLLGHGTGSIKPLYQSLEATQPSPYGEATPDPHNQFFHIVLQVGLVGGALLLAMWAAHAWLFLSRSTAAVLGQAVVLQNVVGSLFNSHISAVTQGMLYCLAVGLLGAVVISTNDPTPQSPS